ncbi:DUF3108 domain-containing protein [Trinickia caryophylli]|uniref:DUF3108 domain-containing protein n=1 Tax=Trinickia caryophylli TaxID=28094 RepID=UPI001180B617|nr:DUF3108 domain-containing protein [Trinickia caryophylli]TRX18743.1 DUF3108 domain-containing protein [Trinickia caryophylli]
MFHSPTAVQHRARGDGASYSSAWCASIWRSESGSPVSATRSPPRLPRRPSKSRCCSPSASPASRRQGTPAARRRHAPLPRGEAHRTGAKTPCCKPSPPRSRRRPPRPRPQARLPRKRKPRAPPQARERRRAARQRTATAVQAKAAPSSRSRRPATSATTRFTTACKTNRARFTGPATGKATKWRCRYRCRSSEHSPMPAGGRIDAFGLAPERYVEHRGRRGENVTTFERDAKRIAFTRTSATLALPDGAQDRFSMVMQLASLVRGDPEVYRPGVTRNFYVADSDSGEIWPIETIGDETVRTSSGFVNARHFMRLPRRAGDSRRIDVWLAPALGWLPVRIAQTEPNGTVVELVWHGRPGPSGSENADPRVTPPDTSGVAPEQAPVREKP